MSHSTETKEIEPEVSNKSDKLDSATDERSEEENITAEPEVSNKSDKLGSATDERSEEENITAVESHHEDETPVKSSENKVDLKERNQLKIDPTESGQHETDSTKQNQKQEESTDSNQQKENFTDISEQKAESTDSSQNKVDFKEASQQEKDPAEFSAKETDSTKLNQSQVESTEPKQQKVDPTESSQQKLDSTKSSRDQVEIVIRDQQKEDQETSRAIKEKSSLRQFVIWTVAEFFDTNPKYLTQVRGIGNLINIGLSLADLVLLSLVCQLRPFPDAAAEGFFCKPPETFLFTVSCCSFLTAVLYFFCCIFSKSTDFLLFQSAFEVAYYILYFILFITGGMIVLVNEMSWESPERWSYEHDSTQIEIAATIALINSIIYALSAVWYFMSHCQEEGSVIEIPEW